MVAPEGAIAIPVGEHFALVDEADYGLVGAYSWRPFHSSSGSVYAYTTISRKTVFMHQLILDTAGGLDTDHRDRNPLNNRRRNLRPATRAQNMANRSKWVRSDGRPLTSMFKGVRLDRRASKWRAEIKVNGRTKHLGYFVSEVDAAKAYDAAADKYFGEFAYLNFPSGIPDAAPAPTPAPSFGNSVRLPLPEGDHS